MNYQQTVGLFQEACQKHLAIKSFNSGPIDLLDSATQDIEFPYIFLRPLTGTGLRLNTNGYGGTNVRNFEIYSLDIPHLTDGVENIKILSDTEQYLYDIIAYFNFGVNQQTCFINVISTTALHEAFNDRATGWVSQIQVTSPYVLDYCNYPQLP